MSLTRIEFVNVNCVDDFYDQLEGQLELDEPLARNLDAVYDLLSTDLPGPAELVWYEAAFSKVALGDWYPRIVDVLNTASNDRNDLRVSFD
ncbi:barstar family protein [Chitinimonas sp. BJYL2]|uniref:barstar family protein n=1 Tax=Chitinimonas sp. BJYL2 TaxID=2976696 RepID=UPI0022B5554C|nr:barstar family protein [Chitinimonas sp. BJYL2]